MAEELARAAHRNTLLATFVEHVDDAIEVVNADYEIEYTNPAHERITGYTLAEALGRTPAELHRPKVHDTAIYTNIEYTTETGQTWKGNMLGQRKDGSLWHQNASISPIRNEKGEITHFIAIKRDVTADIERQQALAESEQRFKDFAEAASDWLWEMDEDLRFVGFTGNEPNIGGRTVDDAVGKTRWELFDANPDEDENWRQHKADLEARRPYRDFRYEFHADNGQTFYLSASGKPIFDEDGRFKGYRGTACDMTIQVESEIARSQSEELLANIVTNLPGRVFRRVLHSDGSITYPYVGSGYEATPTFSWDKRRYNSEEAVRHVHPDDQSMWRAALDPLQRISSHTISSSAAFYRRVISFGFVSLVAPTNSRTRTSLGTPLASTSRIGSVRNWHSTPAREHARPCSRQFRIRCSAMTLTAFSSISTAALISIRSYRQISSLGGRSGGSCRQILAKNQWYA